MLITVIMITFFFKSALTSSTCRCSASDITYDFSSSHTVALLCEADHTMDSFHLTNATPRFLLTRLLPAGDIREGERCEDGRVVFTTQDNLTPSLQHHFWRDGNYSWFTASQMSKSSPEKCCVPLDTKSTTQIVCETLKPRSSWAQAG